MQLTGTIQERIDAAIAFAKAHRSYEYDHETIADLYKQVGVPYTEAAEKIYREWMGVLEGINFYNENPLMYPIDFRVMFFEEEDAEEYFSYYDERTGKYICRIAKSAMKKFGADTVPVAYGGYYYPAIVYVKPDGTILTHHHDYDKKGDYWKFNSFRDFLCMELNSSMPSKVEKIEDWVEFGGTLEECINEDIEYFKAHGGHKNCRLLTYMGAIVDIPKDRDLTDEELRQIIFDYFEKYDNDLSHSFHTVQYIVE